MIVYANFIELDYEFFGATDELYELPSLWLLAVVLVPGACHALHVLAMALRVELGVNMRLVEAGREADHGLGEVGAILKGGDGPPGLERTRSVTSSLRRIDVSGHALDRLADGIEAGEAERLGISTAVGSSFVYDGAGQGLGVGAGLDGEGRTETLSPLQGTPRATFQAAARKVSLAARMASPSRVPAPPAVRRPNDQLIGVVGGVDVGDDAGDRSLLA